jgi:hypothetical protein
MITVERLGDMVPSFCIALISGFLMAVKDIHNVAVLSAGLEVTVDVRAEADGW